MTLQPGSPTAADTEFVQAVLSRLQPIETFARRFYCFLGIVIVVISIAIGVDSDRIFASAFLMLGVSLAVAAAATMVGALLGFLFGIPRSLQQRPAVAPAAADASQTPSDKTRLLSNTSVEEISDWLTKIIIGVGLVQFHTFVGYLYQAALLAAGFAAGREIDVSADAPWLHYKPGYASPFFFALILVCLIAGCLVAYLETRTRLTLLFVSAEKATKEDEKKLIDAAGRSVATIQGRQADQSGPLNAPTPATADDREIAKLSREKLTQPREIMGWALAQARTGNSDVAEDALRDALQKAPENDEIRLRIAEVRWLRGNFAGCVDMLNEVVERTNDPAKKATLLKQILLVSLYVSEPQGFTRAISTSDQLIKANAADALVYLRRAAAFGQKYDWLIRNAGSQEDKVTTRDSALEAVKKTIELSPDYNSTPRTLLRQIFDPVREGSDREDNDLEIFKTDGDFNAVIYRKM
jgi:tetratricopeptide (TPR) repeat protein